MISNMFWREIPPTTGMHKQHGVHNSLGGGESFQKIGMTFNFIQMAFKDKPDRDTLKSATQVLSLKEFLVGSNL